jgi:hypothetical protein
MRELIDVEKDSKCKRCVCAQDLRWHVMRAVGPRNLPVPEGTKAADCGLILPPTTVLIDQIA